MLATELPVEAEFGTAATEGGAGTAACDNGGQEATCDGDTGALG